jgi:hypothetical protein
MDSNSPRSQELLDQILAAQYVILEKLIALENPKSHATPGFHKAKITGLIDEYVRRLREERQIES